MSLFGFKWLFYAFSHFFFTISEEEVAAVTSTLPHHTDLRVGSYPPACIQSTEQEDDYYENTNGVNKSYSLSEHHSMWQKLVEDNNIIVCTGTNFFSALSSNIVQLININLLIFDDCHCSITVGHPYACIVSLVRQLAEEGIPEPRILGVTAAIAGTDCSDPDHLKLTISSMESAMHAKAQTSMLILTERYGCRPQQQVIRCDLDDIDPVGISEEQAQLRQTMEGLLLRDYHFFLDCREQLIKQVSFVLISSSSRKIHCEISCTKGLCSISLYHNALTVNLISLKTKIILIDRGGNYKYQPMKLRICLVAI